AARGARGGAAGRHLRACLGRAAPLDQVIWHVTLARPPRRPHPLDATMQALPDTLCYLDAAYLPVRDPRVSLLDRGFLFGDGLYEVVPVYGKRLFRFDEHMGRLGRSLAKVRIANPHTDEQWLERCRRLVAALAEKTGAADQLVYLQVTRGVAPRDHVMPEDVAPTVFMMANAMKPPTPEQRHQGVRSIP